MEGEELQNTIFAIRYSCNTYGEYNICITAIKHIYMDTWNSRVVSVTIYEENAITRMASNDEW